MSKPFSVNVNRRNPYATYRFLVYFGTSTNPVAGVSKVSALKRSSDVIEYKAGGDLIIRKGLGRTKYDLTAPSNASRSRQGTVSL